MRTLNVILASLILVVGISITAMQPAASDPTAAPSNAGSDQDLAPALKRDLNISVGDFKKAGVTAEKASLLADKLKGKPGFDKVVLEKGSIIVRGTGAEVTQEAKKVGAMIAPTTLDKRLPDVHALLAEFTAQVGQTGMLGIAQTNKGYSVTVQNPDARVVGKKSAREFGAAYPNVEIVMGKTFAKPVHDMLAGWGISIPSGNSRLICSLGFPIFDEKGVDGFLTAGHCGEGRWFAPIIPNDAGTEPARGGQPSTLMTTWLGRMDWAQFGGAASVNGYGTDLSTINFIDRRFYYPTPQVMKWQLASPSAYSNPARVTGMIDPVIGAPVCRSGRTTGWQCSTISYIGYVNVRASATDTRLVFSAGAAGLVAEAGDSGGPAIVGNKAMGITSAIGELDGKRATFMSLMGDFTRMRPGYSMKIWLNTPWIPLKQSETSRWSTGEWVVGSVTPEHNDFVPAGTLVRVVVDGNVIQTAPVQPDGGFGFKYIGPGQYQRLELGAVNGFSRSEGRQYRM